MPLFLTIILAFCLVKRITSSTRCFSPFINDPFKCYSCEWDYFFIGETSLDPFLTSDCQEKSPNLLSLQMLIVSPTSNTDCPECKLKSFNVQTNFFSALVNVSETCKRYINCEVNIYLEASGDDKPHVIINTDNKELELFRRSNLMITVQPLLCGILSAAIACAPDTNYLQTVLIKSPLLRFFFSGTTKLRNIIWDYADMNYNNKESLCWNISKCCTAAKVSTVGDICNQKNREISGNLTRRGYGFLNLELMIDNPQAPIPSLTLENCKFTNLYVPGYGLGFTTLIKNAGYSLFNVSLISTSFENVFFLEGLLDTSLKPDNLIIDPIYQSSSLILLSRLLLDITSRMATSSTLLLIKNVSITSYNSFNFKDMTKSVYSPQNALLFPLGKSNFSTIIFENSLLMNINKQTEKQLHLFSFDCDKNDTLINITNLTASDIASSVFLFANSSFIFRIKNVYLLRWVLTLDNPVFNFQNNSILVIEGITVTSMLSNNFKTAVIYFLNCWMCQLTNIILEKNVGLSIEVSKSAFLNLSQIFLKESQFRTNLFFAESSTFDLNGMSIIGVTAFNQATNLLFSIKCPNFNISSLYINSVSAQSIFDYRDTLSVNLNRFLVENITGVRTFFLSTTTFYFTRLTDITIQNCVLPRFAEFQVIYNVNQEMDLIRLKLINLTLPVLNSDVFAIFTNMNFLMVDSILENVRRIGMGTIPPTAIIWVRRGNFAAFQNCSFKAAGYSFVPVNIVAAFNYALIFLMSLSQYSLRNCLFESDETVSINVGLITSGLCPILEIVNCKLSASSKNPNFIYKAVSIFYGSFINITNNSFTNFSCTPYNMDSHLLKVAPIVLMGEDSLSFTKNSRRLNMQNLSFENCTCQYGNGGALHFSNYHIVTLSNLLFVNNSAIAGGSLEIVSSSNITASNITIILSFAGEAASISFNSIVFMNLSYYKEFFTTGNRSGSWRLTSCEILCTFLQVVNSSSLTNGGFSVLYSSKLQIFGANFSNTSALQFGGAFHITLSSSILLSEANIENPNAMNGGFISGDDANVITIRNSFAKATSAFLNGGFIYIELVFRTFIEKLLIKAGSANNNGMIYIKTADEQSFHNISQVVCEVNTAFLGSCVYFRSSSGLLISGITIMQCFGIAVVIRNDLPLNCSLSNLSALNINKMDYLLEIDNMIANITGLEVKNCSFEKFIIYLKSTSALIKYIYLNSNFLSDGQVLYSFIIKSSNLTLESINFTNLEEKNLACLISADSSFVKIIDSYVEGAKGLVAALVFENSSVILERITFKSNYITCISILVANAFMRNLEFVTNRGYSEEVPSDISIKSKGTLSNNHIYLENVRSRSNYPGQLNNFVNFQYLTQINCSFIAEKIPSSLIYSTYQASIITNVATIHLEGNSFSGFSSWEGAALKISASADIFTVVEVFNSDFKNCTSQGGRGGALSFFNILQVSIIHCYFFGNQALVDLDKASTGISGTGGVGIIYCPVLINKTCSISLEQNSFEANFASLYGPLFVSNKIIETNSVQHGTNNSDLSYFSNNTVYFPPKAFIILPKHDPEASNSIELGANNDSALYDLETLKTVINIKSGETTLLHIIITDNKGLTLLFDNRSTCNIENPLFATYATNIKNGFLVASKGNFIFTGLTLLNKPNSTVNISISIKIPKDLILNEEAITLSYSVRLFFKPCIRGEIVLSDLSCFKCGDGKFSYKDPMEGFHSGSINNQKCEICSEYAICPGGQYDYPRPSYWRIVENSSSFIKCMIPEACLGAGNFTEASRIGLCAEGHYGNLCNDCIEGFGKLESNSLCEPCSKTNSGVIVRFIFSVIFLFAYAVGGSFVYSVQKSRTQKESYLFVILKIAVNFTQQVNLLSFLKFNWVVPSMKKFFSSSSNSISFATEDILLNDCIIQNGEFDINNLYIIKVIIIIFLPIMLFVLTSVFWKIFYFILKLRLRRRNDERNLKIASKIFYVRVFASLVISIFLFHPLIIKSSFNLFNCFRLNEEVESSDSVLNVYPNFRCWTSYHYRVVLAFAIPGILIWGLLFPFILMYVLLKQLNYRRLTSTQIKRLKNEPTLKSPEKASLKNSRTTFTDIYHVSKATINSTSHIETKITVFKMEGDEFVPIEENPVHDQNETNHSPQHSNSLQPKSKKKRILNYIIKSDIFKFIYFGYKSEYPYWESIVFMKKLLISLFTNLNQIIGYEIITLLLVLLLIAFLWLQIRFNPFVRGELNFLETLSQLCLLLIFFCIVTLSTNVPDLLLYACSYLILIVYFMFYFSTCLLIAKSLKQAVRDFFQTSKIFKRFKT